VSGGLGVAPALEIITFKKYPLTVIPSNFLPSTSGRVRGKTCINQTHSIHKRTSLETLIKTRMRFITKALELTLKK
jgi:hypothetical protein